MRELTGNIDRAVEIYTDECFRRATEPEPETDPDDYDPADEDKWPCNQTN